MVCSGTTRLQLLIVTAIFFKPDFVVIASAGCTTYPKCAFTTPCNPNFDYYYCQSGAAINGCKPSDLGPFPPADCATQCVSTPQTATTYGHPVGCNAAGASPLLPSPRSSSPPPPPPSPPPPRPPRSSPPPSPPPPLMPPSPAALGAPLPCTSAIAKCTGARYCPPDGDYLHCLSGIAVGGCQPTSAGVFPSSSCSAQCMDTTKPAAVYFFPPGCTPSPPSPPLPPSPRPPSPAPSPPPPAPPSPPSVAPPPSTPTAPPGVTYWPANWRQMLGPITPPSSKFAATANPMQSPNASLWGPAISKPYPTNEWWSNFVMGDGTMQVGVLPYIVAALPSGLRVGSGVIRAHSSAFIMAEMQQTMMLSAQQGFASRAVQSYDDLSVMLQFKAATGSGSMSTPLLQGLPFVTAVYNGLTPTIVTDGGTAIVSVTPGYNQAAKSFMVVNNAGMTWLIYTSQAVKFSQGNSDGGSLVADKAYTGLVVRIALLQSGQTRGAYDANVDLYPTSASIDFGYQSSSGSVRYNFVTSSMSGGALAGQQLMMMAWPHHMQVLQNAATANPPLRFTNSPRGVLTAVLGSTWTLQYALSGISWNAARSMAAGKVSGVRTALVNEYLTVPLDSANVYYFGAQAAGVARLILIARELGETSIAASLTARLKAALVPWLSGSNQDPWRYDTTWGGLIPNGSLANGRGWAFGAGVYNDHHFHSGYFIYAIAVLGKYDPAFLAQYQSPVLDLVRDYANPANNDAYFPTMRAKDMWAGHSWANGLDSFGDNKNQESTSEAVNSYYALQLLGNAMGNQQLQYFGATMAAMEIASAQAYWHMWTGHSAVGAPFSDNKVAGIVWSTKTDYATWFGLNVEFISCIQMIPFTPMSEALLAPAEWVQELYPILSTAFNRTTPPLASSWRAFIYNAHAIINPQAAWSELNAASGFIDPYVALNTKTNSLYWAATRPGA